MGVYSRFKKDPGGLRHLVELLESTPLSRRQKMIDVGMVEDPEYTKKALSYLLNFKDVLALPDPELAEVIAETPAQLVGYAIHSADAVLKDRFLHLVPPKLVGEVRDALDYPVTPQQIGGAQAKMVELTRKLEKSGVVKSKKIPS